MVKIVRIIGVFLSLSVFFAFLTVVCLHYSRISKDVSLPDLRGSDLPSAITKLKKLGLKVKVKKSSSISKSVPAGYVIAHFPPAGTKIRGGEVELIVSTGKRKVKVPNLKGKDLQEAKLILAKNYLKFGYLAYIDIPHINSEVILAQNPMPQSIVNSGSRVDLLINRRKPTRELLIPNFVGYKAEVANKLAQCIELTLLFLPFYSPEALVVEQNPKADSLVELPATVTLKLAISN